MSEGHDGADPAHHHADPAQGGAGPAEAVQARLRDLADLPVTEHVTVFADVHRELHEALRDDGEPGPGDPGVPPPEDPPGEDG